MANKKVSLVWYCKTPTGWRRFPAVMSPNGRIKTGTVIVEGREVKYPEGRFQLRMYNGKATVYKNAGATSAEALAARDRLSNQKYAISTAEAAGVRVIEEDARLSIRIAVERFIKKTLDSGSAVAAQVYRTALNDFIRATSVTYVDEINADVMAAFHAALKRMGNGDRTSANKFAAVRALLRWAKVDTKALGLKRPKYEQKIPIVYQKASVDQLLESCSSSLRIAISVLRMAGLRDQEMAFLTWDNIDFKRKLLLVRSKPAMGFVIKDYEERDIPMPDALVNILVGWRAANPKTELVIPTSSGRVNRKLLRALKRVANRAGLNCEVCAGCRTTKECRRWTLHSFRRTYATSLHRSGVDMRTIMKLMGHNDLETIVKYLAPLETEEAAPLVNAVKW
jgi:integrase